MGQTLVIKEEFFKSLSVKKNADILKSKGYNSPDIFINAIIKKLNDEFNFFEITNYRFCVSKEEKSLYSQYGAFVEGENLPFEKVIVFFTPIDSKQGNVIIEQSLMPTICNQMEQNLTFLLNNNFKKIAVLTSQINLKNEVPITYNKLQMDVNSLNTLNIDVIPFFPIKNLSTDTKFNSLVEYLDMSNYLQKKSTANKQFEYLKIVNDTTLYGNCEPAQLEGEFLKSFCFRFLTAIFSGGNDYKYDVSAITGNLKKLDNQFANLERFINFANTSILKQTHTVMPVDEDIIESDDDLSDISDIHRKPEKGIDGNGRKRFKTQKKIRDSVLEKANYICDCHDKKHFYFESTDFHNYVEGHHIVPMNRQEEYYFDKDINLDIPNNIVPLCPNCHCQIHLGSRQARIKIISELFVRNKAKLLSFNPELTLSILASYYNIGMEHEEERDWTRRAEKVVSDKNSKII